MATITTLSNPTYATGNLAPRVMDNANMAYRVWREIDLAAAATAKGSALAAADVIEALRLPAGTFIVNAGAQKTAAMTGTSTDLTFDIGTAVDADQYVDGWDFDAAAVGSYATPLGVQLGQTLAASDTIDITIATQTGTLTGGKVLVWALVVDLTTEGRGVIAQPKS
ncbi:hypothetical protein EVB99_103 [Rhizobium phage RHph_N3_19]|nr:hypothetical protein EVB99_103 [Rhizobium phage RHph_N3_19]